MWAWGCNILAVWGLTFFAAGIEAWGLAERRDLLLGAMVWCLWFIVQEGAGWYYGDLARRRGDTRELARTYSQVMQMFAARDPGHSFWQTLTGWDLFVTANCLMVGYIPGYAVGAFWGWAAGWLVGASIAIWNYYHWQNRRKHL